MPGAVAGWLARRMQWKAYKRQTLNTSERRNRLRLRRHASAKGFAARDQGQSRTGASGFRHRGTHGRLRDIRRIGPPAAFFHIGKLIAQARDAAFAKACRKTFHEGMSHPSPRAMGKDITGARLGGTSQKRG